jgi:hypothetical protein
LPHIKSYVLVLAKKADWATLWAIFSQTYLVTLMPTYETEGAMTCDGVEATLCVGTIFV